LVTVEVAVGVAAREVATEARGEAGREAVED
jgi:hypothetical protein